MHVGHGAPFSSQPEFDRLGKGVYATLYQTNGHVRLGGTSARCRFTNTCARTVAPGSTRCGGCTNQTRPYPASGATAPRRRAPCRCLPLQFVVRPERAGPSPGAAAAVRAAHIIAAHVTIDFSTRQRRRRRRLGPAIFFGRAEPSGKEAHFLTQDHQKTTIRKHITYNQEVNYGHFQQVP